MSIVERTLPANGADQIAYHRTLRKITDMIHPGQLTNALRVSTAIETWELEQDGAITVVEQDTGNALDAVAAADYFVWSVRPANGLDLCSDWPAEGRDAVLSASTQLRPRGPGGGVRVEYSYTSCPVETCLRFYFTAHTAGSADGSGSASAPSPAFGAAWDHTSTGRKMLNATPQVSASDANDPWSSSSSTVPANWLTEQFLLPLTGSGLPNPLTGTVRAQMRASARSGVGVSESSQDMISQLVIRVVSSNGLTVRGTALAAHSLASSAGSAKWSPQEWGVVNRVFPPAAAGNGLVPVSWQSGDYLVVEVGCRNFFNGVTGGSAWWDDTASADLPEDETTSSTARSWIELCWTE